ncbi:MAG: protease complex subunit PrcB family protein [Synergistaceae bacterium]|nr:protease complex subunit PrcB family protein [Synergistaceae bacterium]
MSSVSYAFREIARGSFMEAHTESVTVLESNESTLSEFSKLNIPKLEIVDGFDYAKERLVLVVAFACPDSGYSIVIETVDIKDGKTNVNYKTERGPEGKMYAQVISYPWLLAAVER